MSRRLRDRAKQALLSRHTGRLLYGVAQEVWFDASYVRRRERYAALTAHNPDAYSTAAVVAETRRRIAARGFSVRPRAPGDIHTYVYIPSNWQHQPHIARAAGSLGPTTRFDYTKQGFTLAELRTIAPGHTSRRASLQAGLLDDIARTHRQRPIDWFVSYALGWDISAETLRRIHGDLGIPTVNISFDDKNWWDEVERKDRASGLRNLVPHYDLCWTSARSVLPWYAAEGGRGFFLPEGADTDHFRPLDVPQDVDVGFVGSRFGWRDEQIATLRRAGINVVAYGNLWEAGAIDDEEMLRFFNRCKINIGFGDMFYSRWLTNLKGRDFEVPATGRGLYLTTYNPDLAKCFRLGDEVDCYRGIEEAIELIRHYLREREEATAMAARARQRCIAEHQWSHRYATVARVLGLLAESP